MLDDITAARVKAHEEKQKLRKSKIGRGDYSKPPKPEVENPRFDTTTNQQALTGCEVWKTFNHGNNYRVSDTGVLQRRKTYKSDYVTVPARKVLGKLRVSLNLIDEGKITTDLKRVIAEVWIEHNPYRNNDVYVIDGDESNIAFDNLVWYSKVKSAFPQFGDKDNLQVEIERLCEFRHVGRAGGDQILRRLIRSLTDQHKNKLTLDQVALALEIARSL